MTDHDPGVSASTATDEHVTPLDSDGARDGGTAADRLTYEELAVGDRFVADQTVTFTRDSIVDFAGKYDPQPFHVGDDADAASPFEGLVASGLHSFCACNRLATEAFFGRVAFLGGRGVDDLRWHRPVRPDDTLSVDVEVVDKRVSESDSRRGYVDVDVTGRTPAGDPVVTWRVLGMIRRGGAVSPGET
ncbi:MULTISPECIES: MaoC/PaaZ C-terminal domain-containing protein [Halobellus]|uniref:MaoC/PaaZ C-terminal domain-containing protein n=1 Tax=Halobellus TaxID=1073986 RepID=UPI002115CD6E|nr:MULTISPECIES: MaoC/PaaZ C-terminal domain-containing protein [Halobellus]MDQ2053670.1 MaoC/PaaZ C-terminal domain-containing protein [Halobellus sp. H-GB7]